MISFEICANSLQSAINAQQAGAIRIELCSNLDIGGTTPSYGEIVLARKLLDIDVNVLIRPRGGDFVYSDIEFDIIKNDIDLCGSLGCNGVVFGILNSDYTIDKLRCAELVQLARSYNMSVTFHRAFDNCVDLYSSLEDVISLGCNRILTSGGKPSAYEGRFATRDLAITAGDALIIMPGGGIDEQNIQELIEYTGLREFHGSFLERLSNVDRPKNQTDYFTLTSKERVKNIIDIANKCL